MRGSNLFKIIRHSFFFALVIFLTFIGSFAFIFNTFFAIDRADAITTGGPGNKNTDVAQQWEVIQVEDRNGESRIRIRNINSGTDASAAIVVLNDFGPTTVPSSIYDLPTFHFTAFGLSSTGNTETGGLGANSGSVYHSAPGSFGYLNLYDDFFVWKSNPSDDGLLANTVEDMRLDKGDLTIPGKMTIAADPYDSGWDGLQESAPKDAVFDKIEAVIATIPTDISVKVTKTSDQSVPQNTLTMVTWDSEEYDTDDMHDNVTNNSRITFKTAGKYSILAQSEWGINSGGFRFMDIMKNGVDSIARVRDLADNASEHNVAFVGEFEVNDYIELQVFQDTGGNLDFESGAILENTYLEAHKIN